MATMNDIRWMLDQESAKAVIAEHREANKGLIDAGDSLLAQAQAAKKAEKREALLQEAKDAYQKAANNALVALVVIHDGFQAS